MGRCALALLVAMPAAAFAGGSAGEPARAARLLRSARAALDFSDPEGALSVADEVLGADPGNAEARYVRVSAFLKLGRPERAEAEATAGLESCPDDPRLLYARAVARGRRGLWDPALSDADRAVRGDPAAGYGYAARAAAYWGLKRRAEMAADLRAAAERDASYRPALRRAAAPSGDPTLLFEPFPAGPRPAEPPPRAPSRGLYALGGALCAWSALAAGALLRRR